MMISQFSHRVKCELSERWSRCWGNELLIRFVILNHTKSFTGQFNFVQNDILVRETVKGFKIKENLKLF